MFDFDTFAKKVSRNIRESKSQLITEVLNSEKNREYFFQNFCQLTIDLNVLHSSLGSADISEEELLKQEGEFIILQLERKKIYVGVDFLGPIHDMMLKAGLTSRFKRIRSDFYADGFENFKAIIQQLAHNKFADPTIKIMVNALVNHHVGSEWFVSDYDYKNNKVVVKLTRSCANVLFALIIDIFNKRRAVLPKKDIFQYAGNLYDLITQLNIDTNRKSQRELKKGDANEKDINACTVYKDSNVLVIEPKRLIKGEGDEEGLRRAAEMCHTYFGIHRTSLITGETKPGSRWCTAVSPEPGNTPGPDQFGSRFFLKKYLFWEKNNIYYFVSLKDDNIYAVRTAGANPEAIARVQNFYMKNSELVNDPKKMFMQIMMNMTEEVITASLSSLGSLPNLLQKFGLGLNWAQEHIKFVDMPKQTANTQQEIDKESNLV